MPGVTKKDRPRVPAAQEPRRGAVQVLRLRRFL